MIIACPNCATRYDIPDAAIGATGRKLKCAACGNGWHVDAVGQADQPPADLIAAPIPRAPGPAAPPPLPVAPVAASAPPPAPVHVAPVQEAPSPFDYQPPFDDRGTGRRRLLWIVGSILLLVVLAGLAFGLDVGGVRDRLGVVRTSDTSPLVVRFTTRPMRRSMDSGNELLAIAGQVVNTTRSSQRVPDIRAELRDAQGRTVYDWTIGAPATRLAPGQTADFNAAEVDVPAAARTVHLRPGTLPRV